MELLGRRRVDGEKRCSMTTSGMGGSGRSSFGKKICTSTVEELNRVLQMVIDLVFLDHEKGRVR
jgi:hypothetical protein